MSTFLDPILKFKFKKKKWHGITIRNWILHVLSTDDNKAYSIQEAQSKLKRSKSLIHKCTKGLDHYVALPLPVRGDDPFQWWKKTQETLPLPSKLASKYLSAPPSSIESERLFNTGGNVYEPTWNRLCPENGETLMFLYYNLRVFNFKYWWDYESRGGRQQE